MPDHVTPIRCALYVRVSSRKQVDGVSLEDQEHHGRAFAIRMGWTVTRVYAEPGRSAFVEDVAKRVAFQELLGDARARKFDVVLVYKLNRFARNVPMQYQAAAELERSGVQIASVTEPIERATASGRATFGMLAVMAQLQSDQLSEKMRDTRRAEARLGRHVGPIPVGYWRNAEGVLIPSEDAEAVRMAARLRASGQHSYTTIARSLNDAGWRIPNVKGGTRRRYTKFAVEELLKNETYVGKVRCNGEVFDGQHMPLIDNATWATLRAVEATRAGRRGRPAQTVIKAPEASLLDLAFCAVCGARMWLQPKSGTRRHPYYLCADRATGGSCRNGMVQADVVEVQLLGVMERLAIPTTWHAAILARAAALATTPAPSTTRSTIQAELRALRQDFVDERVDEHTYQKEKARLSALLDAEQHATQLPDVTTLASLLASLPALLAKATPLERHAVYRSVMERVWLAPHRIVALTPATAYAPMLRAAAEELELQGQPDVGKDERCLPPLWYAFQMQYEGLDAPE